MKYFVELPKIILKRGKHMNVAACLKQKLKKEMGIKIKNRRLLLKITIEQMAENLDVSESFYNFVEKGDRGVSLHRILDICKILNITPNELFGHEQIDINIPNFGMFALEEQEFIGRICSIISTNKCNTKHFEFVAENMEHILSHLKDCA